MPNRETLYQTVSIIPRRLTGLFDDQIGVLTHPSHPTVQFATRVGSNERNDRQVTLMCSDGTTHPASDEGQEIAAYTAAATKRSLFYVATPGSHKPDNSLSREAKKMLGGGDFSMICGMQWAAFIDALGENDEDTKSLSALRIGYSGFGAYMALQMAAHAPKSTEIDRFDLWDMPTQPDKTTPLLGRLATNMAVPYGYKDAFARSLRPMALLQQAISNGSVSPATKLVIVSTRQATRGSSLELAEQVSGVLPTTLVNVKGYDPESPSSMAAVLSQTEYLPPLDTTFASKPY